MNYYIDFDNTLYNTSLLVEKMLDSIVESIYVQKKIDKTFILDECKKLFAPQNIYDIYKLIHYFSKEYSLDESTILNEINTLILNRNDLVFDDSISFLEKLYKNNNIFLLSYASGNLKYQTTKVLGSGLLDYFDGIYITSKPKYDLDIDYTNGIFIDDNPKDLEGLYSKNPKKLIRLRRNGNKYSKIELNIQIEEYKNLSEINL